MSDRSVMSRLFSLGREDLDRVTRKDLARGGSVLLLIGWVLSLVFFPIMLLAELFEWVFALLLLVSVFAFSISSYRLVADGFEWSRLLICAASGFVLIGYFVVVPLAVRAAKARRPSSPSGAA